MRTKATPSQPEQSGFRLTGHASDPVMEEVIANPERVVRFRFTEHPSYFRIELLDESGNSTGAIAVVSKTLLQHSRRAK